MKISLQIGLIAALIGTQPTSPRKDIPAIAKAANGAIVSIIMSDKDGHAIVQGTGFLISKDGRIVTNYHVIENGSSAIVKLPDGAFFVVDGVLAFDNARDVAVIKAHGENFRTLTLGNSDRVQVGQEVVAIGNPLSLESTVSNGIVSGIRTEVEEGGKFLQVTTPISPGSSGGPLFNMAGEVVGITTLYLKGGENLNFAIPINDAKPLLLPKFSKVQDLPNKAKTPHFDLKGDTLGEDAGAFHTRWYPSETCQSLKTQDELLFVIRCTVKTTFANEPAILVAEFVQLGRNNGPELSGSIPLTFLRGIDYEIELGTAMKAEAYIESVTALLTRKYGQPVIRNPAGAMWKDYDAGGKTETGLVISFEESGGTWNKVHISLQHLKKPDM